MLGETCIENVNFLYTSLRHAKKCAISFAWEALEPPHFSFANPSFSISTFSRATVSCANFVYCAELM